MLIEIGLETKNKIREVIGVNYTTLPDVLLDDTLYNTIYTSDKLTAEEKEKLRLARKSLEGTIKTIDNELVKKYMDNVESIRILDTELVKRISRYIGGEYRLIDGTSVFLLDPSSNDLSSLLEYPITNIYHLDRIIRERIPDKNTRILYRDPSLLFLENIRGASSVSIDYERFTISIENGWYRLEGIIRGVSEKDGVLLKILKVVDRSDRYLQREWDVELEEGVIDFNKSTISIPSMNDIKKILKIYEEYPREVWLLLFYGYNIEEGRVINGSNIVLTARKTLDLNNQKITVEANMISRKYIEVRISTDGVYIQTIPLKGLNVVERTPTSITVRGISEPTLLKTEYLIHKILYDSGTLTEGDLRRMYDESHGYFLEFLTVGYNVITKNYKRNPLIPLSFLFIITRNKRILTSLLSNSVQLTDTEIMLISNYIDGTNTLVRTVLGGIIHVIGEDEIIVNGRPVSNLIKKEEVKKLIPRLLKRYDKYIIRREEFKHNKELALLVAKYSSNTDLISSALEQLTRRDLINLIKTRGTENVILSNSNISKRLIRKMGNTCNSDSSMYCSVFVYIITSRVNPDIRLGFENGKYYLYSDEKPGNRYYVLSMKNGQILLLSKDWRRKVVSLDELRNNGLPEKLENESVRNRVS